MRAKLLLVGGLALLLGACGAKTTHGPPPLNKQLLVGKWKNPSELVLITGYEFAEDGAFKMTVQGTDRPVPGRFTWSGERDLDLKYEGEEARKAYQAAAKALKDKVQGRMDKKELDGRVGSAILASIHEELPAEEKVRVGLADPGRLLVLTTPDGESRRFDKAE
jgi:hypothetical protein